MYYSGKSFFFNFRLISSSRNEPSKNIDDVKIDISAILSLLYFSNLPNYGGIPVQFNAQHAKLIESLWYYAHDVNDHLHIV